MHVTGTAQYNCINSLAMLTLFTAFQAALIVRLLQITFQISILGTLLSVVKYDYQLAEKI